MISPGNILTIAKFESRVLWRNWFFRIFSLLMIFILVIFNLANFSKVDDGNWIHISNSWGIPYANMIMLNIGQAAAIIFMGTGIIKKNKKIDTNEVLLVRSISNIDFVFGKAFALFSLFFWLNVLILTIGLIFNLTNSDAQFNAVAYIIYPLLTSVPNIIFTTGIAFLIVTVLRNQPVSIILLLGISGVVLIYFQGKYSNIFDFMGFKLSMMASDIAGFSSLKGILMQRSFYLIAGIAFLIGTAFFDDRLSQHPRNKYITALFTVILSGYATYIMISLWEKHLSILESRDEMIAINDQWTDIQNIEIVSNHITLELQGDEILCNSSLIVRNNYKIPLPEIYFTLNPDLHVQEIKVNDLPIEYEQNHQIVSIKKEGLFVPEHDLKVQIKYKGKILEDAAYLEVDQTRYENIDPSFIFNIQKRYGFLQSDYLLLTKDVLWYPDTQIGYSRKSPIKGIPGFIDFKLDVKVSGSLIPISQGEYEEEEGTYKFRPEYPLPQISLTIGNYKKKQILVDSTEYLIYHYPDNDYFSSYFDQLEDTLDILIKDLKNGYEHEQQLYYPFRQLKFVEVPIQFFAYNKIYEDHQSYVQPEIIFWPEKGGDLRDLDLERQFKRMDEQAREQNQVLNDKEKQANVFNNVMKRVFTAQLRDSWFFDGRNLDEENYSIFPNYYWFKSGIVSNEWPLLNKSISNYLNNIDLPENDYSRNLNGISFAEECNELMSKFSIMEILTQEQEFNKIQKSVSMKGEYLFYYLEQLIGEEKFKEFLNQWANRNQHRMTNYSTFRLSIMEVFNLDIDPIIQQVYYDTSQPSFVFDNPLEYEILDGDRKRYQVIFDVENTGSIDGVIEVSFNSGNEFTGYGFFRRKNPEVSIDESGSLTLIKKGQTKQLGFLLDNKPEGIMINTLVSKNIPSVIDRSFGKIEMNKKAIVFEGEKVIEKRTSSTQHEIVVDNEDAGFTTFSPIRDTYLKEFLDSRYPSDKKYYGNWRRSSSKWLATTGSNFYGSFIRSAHFTRSGSGDKITQWTPELNESGFYDLYVYLMGKNQNEYSRRDSDNKNYTYQYIVNHADGKDEINFNITNAERGWNYLGSYYFSKSGGSVIQTDKCELRTVYADAIKWVKQ